MWLWRLIRWLLWYFRKRQEKIRFRFSTPQPAGRGPSPDMRYSKMAKNSGGAAISFSAADSPPPPLPTLFYIDVEAQPYNQATGQTLPVDGAGRWFVDNADLVSVVSTGDLTARLTSLGPLGAVQVTFAVDARVGPDVNEISGSFGLTVIALEDTNVGFKFGPPVAPSA